MKRLQILWAVGMVLILGSAAWGQDIEEYALIQGKLTLTGGSIPDGNYPMESHLYNEPTGGVPLYEETHSSVAVSGGLFTLNLGSVTPIPDSLFKIVPLWLEMVVNSEVITPRIRLASVPRAFHVRTIDGAKGGRVLSPLTIDGDLFVESPLLTDPRKIKITGNPPVLEFGSRDVQAWVQTHEISHALGMVHAFDPSDYLTSPPAFTWSSKFGAAPELELLRITSTGKVGVGTTAPSAKLEVVIDSPTTKGMVIQGSPGQTADFIEVKNSAGVNMAGVNAAGTFFATNIEVADTGSADWGHIRTPVVKVEGKPGQTEDLTKWTVPAPGGGSNTVAVVDATGKVGIGTGSPHSTLDVNGSFSTNVSIPILCSDFTLNANHSIVLVNSDACTEERRVHLPTAVGISGRQYTIKHVGSNPGYGPVSVWPVTGEFIEGATWSGFIGLTSWITLVSDGTGWVKIGGQVTQF